MAVDKIKELLPEEDLKMDLMCQKANDFVLDNAVAKPAAKQEEKAAE